MNRGGGSVAGVIVSFYSALDSRQLKRQRNLEVESCFNKWSEKVSSAPVD